MSRALSVREYIAWFLILMVAAGTSAFMTLQLPGRSWPDKMAHFEGAPVIVEAPRIGAPVFYAIYVRMEHGTCKVSRVTADHKEIWLFTIGKGSVTNDTIPPGDSLRLDPQGNAGEYAVRFE